MEFEWDERKNQANRAKHGISFEEAVVIFEGPILTLPDDRFDYGEPRVISIGSAGSELFLTVVHTDRNGKTRVISARRANRRERSLYHAYYRAKA